MLITADEARKITKYAQHEGIFTNISKAIQDQARMGGNCVNHIIPHYYEISYIIKTLEALGGYKCRAYNGLIEIVW
jgi:hypothetical protein